MKVTLKGMCSAACTQYHQLLQLLIKEAPRTLGDTEQRGTLTVLFEKIEVCLADAADVGISRGKTRLLHMRV